jgi:alkylation response protein AidB-like acyl-CoA dehydrogenase
MQVTDSVTQDYRAAPQTDYMPRDLFTPEHEAYRQEVRAFVEEHLVPHHADWEAAGVVDRDVWRKAGERRLLYVDVPEQYGGRGLDDYRYNVVLIEELARAGITGVPFPLGTDIVVPYILEYGSEAQKARWLPKIVAGEWVTAIAMSEPHTGSDLAALQTTAKPDGDDYVINGTKYWITNGSIADLIITAVKTNPEMGHFGMSLVGIETDTDGVEVVQVLDKIGYHARDVTELAFHDVRVPQAHRLGDEGEGFIYMMQQLPQERLSIALGSVCACEQALDWAIAWCKEREAFGRPIGTFQHNRFTLAELKTEVQIARVFVDRCVREHTAGRLSAEQAAMAKWWVTELQQKVADRGLQLFGGRGYLQETPMAQLFVAGRVETIYGGTTEIMKEIIGKAMGF